MLFTAVEPRRVQYDELTEDDTVVAAATTFRLFREHPARPTPDKDNRDREWGLSQ